MSTSARSTLIRLAMLATMPTAVMVTSASCDDTRTTWCSSWGTRCATGWTCAASQDICIKDGCGNGIIEQSLGEVCDDGNVMGNDSCSADCKSLVGCGNGRLDSGEACDNGNNLSGDGCSADCLSDETCGNGYRDVDEACDDGNNASSDGCSKDCKFLETCGDGVRDRGEVCDDDNNMSRDGCSADCLSNEICGNAYKDVEEDCDVGPDDDGTCDADCSIPECGDGYHNSEFKNPMTNEPEACDDAGNSATCNGNCTSARCGDGYFNELTLVDPDDDGEGHFEACDDGDNDNSNACVKDCKVARCGDAYTWEGMEECDQGNGNNSDEPNADCREDCKLRKCGDGIEDDDSGESCDDGNENTSDACPDGHGGTCEPARCGDGFIHAGHEGCDPAAMPTGCGIGQTCVATSPLGDCTCQMPAM